MWEELARAGDTPTGSWRRPLTVPRTPHHPPASVVVRAALLPAEQTYARGVARSAGKTPTRDCTACPPRLSPDVDVHARAPHGDDACGLPCGRRGTSRPEVSGPRCGPNGNGGSHQAKEGGSSGWGRGRGGRRRGRCQQLYPAGCVQAQDGDAGTQRTTPSQAPQELRVLAAAWCSGCMTWVCDVSIGRSTSRRKCRTP